MAEALAGLVPPLHWGADPVLDGLVGVEEHEMDAVLAGPAPR